MKNKAKVRTKVPGYKLNRSNDIYISPEQYLVYKNFNRTFRGKINGITSKITNKKVKDSIPLFI